MKRRKDNEYDNNYKINCNVSTCAHNCVEDSTCLLREIKVARIKAEESGDADMDTACHSYKYLGHENSSLGNYKM